MEPFHTSLLREKFTISEIGGKTDDTPPVIALSNRLVVTFANEKGQERETFVIRTQNMHSCARFAAAIAREIDERGPITYRVSDFPWNTLWGDVVKGFELDWNPDIWCALYMNGKLLYHEGTHHPFLDVIEHCDAAQKGDYAEAIPMAEKIFQQAGKLVTITYDSNIALVITLKPAEAKCGIVLRGANKTTTFSFKALERKDKDVKLRIPTILLVCAAFLEGIQLTFQIGLMNYKYAVALFEKYSDEYRRMERTTARLASLNRATLQFDKDFAVTYRPEQPDFQRYIAEARACAEDMLAPKQDDAQDAKAS